MKLKEILKKMCDIIKIKKMISYDNAYNDKLEIAIGGLGGFFGIAKSMRWKDYLETYESYAHKYCEAFRDYVLNSKLKKDGNWHQNSDNGVPLFSDGKVAMFSLRGWGDIMAAIWSEEEDKDYDYRDFYIIW